MLGLSSCEGPMGPQGPRGIQGPQGPAGSGTVVTVVDIDVPADRWVYSDIAETDDNPGNNYFYANIPDMEDVITKEIYDGGLIKIYREFDTGTSYATQIELPHVSHQEYWYNIDGDPNNYVGLYTETIDYQFGIGSLVIYYTASDFEYEVDETIAPVGMHFRCVIMY